MSTFHDAYKKTLLFLFHRNVICMIYFSTLIVFGCGRKLGENCLHKRSLIGACEEDLACQVINNRSIWYDRRKKILLFD